MITELFERGVAALESIAKSLPEVATVLKENVVENRKILAFRQQLTKEDLGAATATTEALAAASTPEPEKETPAAKRTRATPKAAPAPAKEEPVAAPAATETEQEEEEPAGDEKISDEEITLITGEVRAYYARAEAGGVSKATYKGHFNDLRDKFNVAVVADLTKSQLQGFRDGLANLPTGDEEKI